ncbi:MAG: YraN family protein [Holosporales bacterium]|jgi:putative endonuclease|nr:YraN family protein [Holosporales bacterium]
MVFLRAKGYRILRHRYKCKQGEVDIICEKRHAVVFIEVKYRSTLDQALFAVDKQKYNRIQKVALHFIKTNPQYHNCNLRVDIVAIGRFFSISHQKNVIL